VARGFWPSYEQDEFDELEDRGPWPFPEPVKSRATAWLRPSRMSQTEVALRLAVHLIARRVAATPVSVALTGGELTRADAPRFPVVDFLEAHGFVRREGRGAKGWKGTYAIGRARATLILHGRFDDSDLTTTLTNGRRLVCEVSGGPIEPTRSPTETKLLRSAIGKLLTKPGVVPDDLLVVAVPRSARFRDLAVQWLKAPRLEPTGIRIVVVDRAGSVIGCGRRSDEGPVNSWLRD
jgi:hypothetical protein